MESRIFFPLRSNARSLLAGAPAQSIRRRIKLAAVLHDYVLIEDGSREILAGPSGSWQVWHPPTRDQSEEWQTARERSVAKQREFYVALRPSEAPQDAPFRTMMRSQTSVNWLATFEPLKRELPKAYPWLLSGHLEDSPDVKQVASRWAFRDRGDGRLRVLLPEQFVRSRVIENANLDLAMSRKLDAAVSIEPLHAAVTRARVERGDAHAVLGHTALDLLVPRVGDLDWDDVDELRRHRDILYYRAVLREIEDSARRSAASEVGVEARIHEGYRDAWRRAQDRLAGSLGGRVVKAGAGFLIGEAMNLVLGEPPGLAGAVGAAVALAIDEARPRPKETRWLAVDTALRARGRVDH
jgi:hypothetical protein